MHNHKGVRTVVDNSPSDEDLDEDRNDEWPAEVGQKLLAYRLMSSNDDIEEVIDRIVQALYAEQDPTTEDIHAAREALDTLRYDIEEFAAPVAGVEPWGDGINRYAPNRAERAWSDRDVATDGGREHDR